MRLIDADALAEQLNIRKTCAECEHSDGVFCKKHDDFVDACEAIFEAPTINPEPHWIPVTEDTPTEDGDYWCTFGAETGWFVDWCSWYQGRWVVWLNDEPNPVSNVIAWCKPFEPYKE